MGESLVYIKSIIKSMYWVSMQRLYLLHNHQFSEINFYNSELGSFKQLKLAFICYVVVVLKTTLKLPSDIFYKICYLCINVYNLLELVFANSTYDVITKLIEKFTSKRCYQRFPFPTQPLQYMENIGQCQQYD